MEKDARGSRAARRGPTACFCCGEEAEILLIQDIKEVDMLCCAAVA